MPGVGHEARAGWSAPTALENPSAGVSVFWGGQIMGAIKQGRSDSP